MNTKRCSRCKAFKSVELYSLRSSAKDGLQSFCKACKVEYGRSTKAKESKRKYDNSAKGKAAKKICLHKEGHCVYIVTFIGGRYVGSGITSKRRRAHFNGSSRIARSLGVKALDFTVQYKGTKEEVKRFEGWMIEHIGIENLLNERRP